MRIIRLAGTAFFGALGIAAATPAAAVTTTLDFSGNICGAAGNQACGNGTQIGQNYGDGTGVNVSYRSFNSSNVTVENFLKYWTTGYGDLQGVAYGGNSPADGSEITFTALAGYELTVLGFDAGCYLNRTSCRTFPFTITEIGGSQVAGGTATPPSGSHDSFTFNLGYSTSGYVLRWGPDGWDGGLDNIAFDVRATGVVVPEPSTWALLILGFGLVGSTMRRRGAAKLAFA